MTQRDGEHAKSRARTYLTRGGGAREGEAGAR